MLADGTFEKLPKKGQERLKKDFLVVRGYNKGVAFDKQQFYDSDDKSWLSECPRTVSLPRDGEGTLRKNGKVIVSEDLSGLCMNYKGYPDLAPWAEVPFAQLFCVDGRDR
jgi:hypothetical protein